VSVDRMERGSGSLSAIAEIQQRYEFPVFAIVDVKQIMAYLHNRPIDGKVYIDDEMKTRMEAYLRRYGCVGRDSE
jgi:orotate phosphoribosyltransferase